MQFYGTSQHSMSTIKDRVFVCYSHHSLLLSTVFLNLFLSLTLSLSLGLSISILKRVLLRAILVCAEALSVIFLQSALIHHTANMWPLQPYIISAQRRERARGVGWGWGHFCSPPQPPPSSSSFLFSAFISHQGFPPGRETTSPPHLPQSSSLSPFTNESVRHQQGWREGVGGSKQRERERESENERDGDRREWISEWMSMWGRDWERKR